MSGSQHATRLARASLFVSCSGATRAPRSFPARRSSDLSTLAGGPTREREVVERHHHLQAQALGVHEQSEIAIERGVVPMAFGGLEPAPLEAQAMRVLTELRRRAAVFFGAPVPPLRGLADAR